MSLLPAAIFLAVVAAGQPGPMRELVLPFPADAFDAQRGPDGSLHVVFSRRGGTFYARRPAGEAGFGKALAVAPDQAPIALGGHERKPMLALGKAGRLHVLRQVKGGLLLSTSADDGRTWKSSTVRDAGARGPIDMPALAAAADGKVYVVWVDERDGHPRDDRYAAHLYMASSSDGLRFGRNVLLTRGRPRACPCCQPAAAVDGAGRLWVAYRSSVANIKETQLLIVSGGKVQAKTLSEHRWRFEGCPMDGPSLAVGAEQAAAAWSSDGVLFAAGSADGGRNFSPAERLGQGRYHAASAGREGVLIAWDEGPDTGWRYFGKPVGERLPMRPGGRLVADGAGFLVVRKSAAE